MTVLSVFFLKWNHWFLWSFTQSRGRRAWSGEGLFKASVDSREKTTDWDECSVSLWAVNVLPLALVNGRWVQQLTGYCTGCKTTVVKSTDGVTWFHPCAPLTLIHTTVSTHFYTDLTTEQFQCVVSAHDPSVTFQQSPYHVVIPRNTT